MEAKLLMFVVESSHHNEGLESSVYMIVLTAVSFVKYLNPLVLTSEIQLDLSNGSRPVEKDYQVEIT